MRKSKMLLCLVLLITAPAYGGWWTNYEDENWCHRVGELKYCLPEGFKLTRIDDAQLTFRMRQGTQPSLLANYLGNDTVEEVLAPTNMPDDSVVRSETYVNDLRIMTVE